MTFKRLKELKKNKKGFTLIEIIVVVVILAVLMAVAVPSVLKYLDEADNAKYMAQARAIMTSAQAEIIKDYAPDKKVDVVGDSDKLSDAVTEAVKGDGIEVTSLDVYTDTAASAEIDWTNNTPDDIKAYKAVWTYDSKPVNATILPNGSITINPASE